MKRRSALSATMTLVCSAMAASFVCMGCEPASDGTGTAATNDPSEDFDEERWKPATPPPPPPLIIKWSGPEFELHIQEATNDPPAYSVGYEVTVPTGGYELRFDHVSHVKGEALVFVYLVRPAADEVVTQMRETLRGSYEAGEKPIKTARLYVCGQQRGATNSSGVYSFELAAMAP